MIQVDDGWIFTKHDGSTFFCEDIFQLMEIEAIDYSEQMKPIWAREEWEDQLWAIQDRLENVV